MSTSAMLSFPVRQLALQNYGKPTFVHPPPKGSFWARSARGAAAGKSWEADIDYAAHHGPLCAALPPFVYPWSMLESSQSFSASF